MYPTGFTIDPPSIQSLLHVSTQNLKQMFTPETYALACPLFLSVLC